MSLPKFPFSSTFEGAVEAFEAALRQGGEADLSDFLPDKTHPRYLAILQELVRIDLECGWQNGAPRGLPEYRSRFPELFADADNALALARDERRLREQHQRCSRSTVASPQNNGHDSIQQSGDAAGNAAQIEQAAHLMCDLIRKGRENGSDVKELLASLPPTNRLSVQVFQELHDESPQLANRMAEGLTSFPEAGGEFQGFLLERELGRGAFGRVFLARQGALAGRLVAIKIAPDIGGESQTLAQLQHTHIVPIYSFHHAEPLQAVCMPYLGGHTLSDVLRELRQRAALPRSGTELLSSLLTQRERSRCPVAVERAHERGAQAAVLPIQRAAAVLKKLENWSYIEAVLWLGCCLADGLAHAHERGILHRDLKPANILITDEGQPMLLDFSLAEDTKLRRLASAARVGGTLPYMAPEHLEAFSGANREVDGRADIFALGLILSELLTGRPGFTLPDTKIRTDEAVQMLLRVRKQTPPSIRQNNRAISPAAAAIVRKCLEPDPARRYQSSQELQEDLQRQLENRRLTYAPDRSVPERVRKLVRRSPRLPAKIAAAIAFCLLLSACWFGFRWHELQQGEAADSAAALFRSDLNEIHFILNTPQEQHRWEEHLQLCRRNLEQYAVLADSSWRRRALFSYLDQPQKDRLEKEIGGLLFLYVRFSLRGLQSGKGKSEDLQYYLRLNREAEQCLSRKHPSSAVLSQRAELLERMGKSKEAEELFAKSPKQKLENSQDLYIQAQEFTSKGNFRQAEPLLLEAVKQDPRDYWGRFLLGICYDGLNKDRDAVGAYTVCIALDPSFYGAYFQRGLAFLRERNFIKAREDFDGVIANKEELVKSYVNRGLAWRGLKEYDKAISDLTKALELGGESRVYFIRARIKKRLGDEKGYQQDMQDGLRRVPADEKSWIARGLARAAREPEGALADFDEALKLNPFSRAAWNNKAYVLAKYVKKPEQSVKMLDKVIEYYPDYAPAYSGRGVLFGRLGQRESALQDAKSALVRDSRPPILYQVGCIYALTSKTHPEDRTEALRLLFSAVRQGFGVRYLTNDEDLDPLRALPEFQRLLAAANTLR